MEISSQQPVVASPGQHWAGLSLPLRECGEVAALRLASAFSEALTEAIDQLFVDAKEALTTHDREIAMKASELARTCRAGMVCDFMRHFETHYVKACEYRHDPLQGHNVGFDVKNLKIVDHHVLDDSLAPGMMAESIQNVCWHILQKLTAKFQGMLNAQSLSVGDLPLGPRVIERAVASAINDQVCRHDTKQRLERALRWGLASRVGQFYRDLADHLSAQDLRGDGLRQEAVRQEGGRQEALRQSSAPLPDAPLPNATAAQALQTAAAPEPERVEVEALEPDLASTSTPAPTVGGLAPPMIRHSGEGRNPEKSTTWTPAFAGVTGISNCPIQEVVETDLPAQFDKQPDEQPGEQSEARSMQALLATLSVGTWLAISEPGTASKELKLAWISPRKSLFLLTNRQGERALSLTSASLLALLNEGRAVVKHLAPQPNDAKTPSTAEAAPLPLRKSA